MPQELGLPLRIPYGESSSIEVAFNIAIVEAISDIWLSKYSELEGTPFHAIPSDNFRQEAEVDHLCFAKIETLETSKYLDRCVRFTRTYQNTSKLVSNELEKLV